MNYQPKTKEELRNLNLKNTNQITTMNENLNLVEILKDCPRGTKLYSIMCGEVELEKINIGRTYPIVVKTKTKQSNIEDLAAFTSNGMWSSEYNGECMLFPSKDQRDWSKFRFKKPKFDPKTLKPFDKVLVRNENTRCWMCALYSHKKEDKQCIYKYVTTDYNYRYCIPYNDDTKHLVGTTKEAPKYYRYWED